MSLTDEAPEAGEVEEAFADKKELFLRKFPVRRVSFKALFVVIQLIERVLIGELLASRLDGEVGLSKSDDGLAGISVLYDQITGVTGESNVVKSTRVARECVIFRVQGKFIGGAEQFAPLLF